MQFKHGKSSISVTSAVVVVSAVGPIKFVIFILLIFLIQEPSQLTTYTVNKTKREGFNKKAQAPYSLP